MSLYEEAACKGKLRCMQLMLQNAEKTGILDFVGPKLRIHALCEWPLGTRGVTWINSRSLLQ